MAIYQTETNLGTVPKLEKVIMQLTTKCNANCFFCMNGGNKKDTTPFNADQFKKVIRDSVKGNKKNVNLKTVAYTGGEPLLEKDLLLDLAKFNLSQGLNTMLVSNAILMTEELSEELYHNGVNIARVSLDTYKREKYSEMRGVENGFEKVINGLEYMLNSNMYVIVRYTLNKSNLDDLIGTYKLCNELNIDEFQLRIVSPYGRADKNVVPTVSECEKAFNELFDIEDKVKITTPCFFLAPCTQAKINHRMKACPCAREWVYITIDGSMYPCNYFPEYTRLGNFYHDDIDSIWEHNYYLKQIREEIPQECLNCEHWENCYNQCQGLVYSLTNDFNQTCFNALKNTLKYE